MNFTKTHENIVIIIVIAAAFFLWNSIILFPLKLIPVIFHEMAHVIAALATGGYQISVQITNDLGGITSSKASNEIVVLTAGYAGSVIFGSAIYYSALKPKILRPASAAISVLFLAFGLIFIKNEFGIIASLSIALFFGAIFFIKNQTVLTLILKIIALINISYVINDVIYDTFLSTNIYSDAVRLEQITGFNDWLWGALWIAVALIALLLIMKNMLNYRTKKK